MTSSIAAASAPAPVPFAIARSMLSLGIDASLAFWTASWSDGLPSRSPPCSRAAVVIARASFVKSLPRRESTIAFLCLIDAHLEWPDMPSILPPLRASVMACLAGAVAAAVRAPRPARVILEEHQDAAGGAADAQVARTRVAGELDRGGRDGRERDRRGVVGVVARRGAAVRLQLPR